MKYLSTIILLLLSISLQAQNVKRDLEQWAKNYQPSDANVAPSKLKYYNVNDADKIIEITFSDGFEEQHLTPANVTFIYDEVRSILPSSLSKYDLRIITDGRLIEDLVPPYYRTKQNDRTRHLSATYKGKPWVLNESRPYTISQGLEGTHISLWQSHGRYYKAESATWRWQRPRLFCTCEDLLTLNFVTPYIIPMLQNAGAIVFTPRERDWQTNEVIVDNDRSNNTALYSETPARKRSRPQWQTASDPGFSQNKSVYTVNDTPFLDGTFRYAPTVSKEKDITIAQWIPNIPQDGKYAVYVTYHSYQNSTTDAHYTVHHKGGETHFSVNQQMGGGTWTYLGTFEFDHGTKANGRVTLTNLTNEGKNTVVTADAVRFGGGMGNIAPATYSAEGVPSGFPRWAEAAKYSTVWYGFPHKVHTAPFGTDDMSNDINSRSASVNYLSRGSIFNPSEEQGLRVPLELNVAFHSDAGIRRDDSFVGPLAIYKTDFNDGKTSSGIDRYTSRDLSSMFLTEFTRDLAPYGWTVRKLWNRNYGEAREPLSPACILEMFSHQNFADMRLAYDPKFRFDFSRSVYKTIVKYLATLHKRSYVIQPLPVTDLSIQLGHDKKHTVTLKWKPTDDPLEPSAKADHYIVYTRVGNGGFDNGTLVNNPEFTTSIIPGLPFSFRVTAVNKGGESFPSETLSAGYAEKSRGDVLVVNAFTRLSGPQAINTETTQGFDLDADPGVPYGAYAGYCGRQTGWSKANAGKETGNGLGVSGSELEGKVMMGNTFDYSHIHGRAILNSGYSYTSTSESAIQYPGFDPSKYYALDIYYGVQKQFIQNTSQILRAYLQTGGRVILSGANISDTGILQKTTAQHLTSYAINQITGCGLTFDIYREMNPVSYAIPAPSVLQATSPAFPMMTYSNGQVAAIASNAPSAKSVQLGFPLEAVKAQSTINQLMAAFLQFLK